MPWSMPCKITWPARHLGDGYNNDLYRLSSYGLHAIQPFYATWFGRSAARIRWAVLPSNMRLEAATGEDFSDAADIRPPDG